MTVDKLQKLGLSLSQAKLYLAALELSPIGASGLAEKAGIERTASYNHLNDLVKMGLLTIAFENNRTVFIAENPKKLQEILDEKQRNYNDLLPELMSIFNVKGQKPKVRYYQGQEGMRTVLSNSLGSGCKEMLHINPFNNVIEALGEEFARRYIETRATNKIFVKALRLTEEVSGPWEFKTNDENILREIRYLPEKFDLKVLLIVYNNTVAVISSIKENYGLEIDSKEFAGAMRSFFDVLWQSAEKNIVKED